MAWQVKFYDTNEINDSLLRYAVIVAKYEDKWVFCRHKDRQTWELPGGHREDCEAILSAASRELNEETGANRFDLKPICVYSIIKDDSLAESYGLLCYAEIFEFEQVLRYEIKDIDFFYTVPKRLTYPEAHLALFLKINEVI